MVVEVGVQAFLEGIKWQYIGLPPGQETYFVQGILRSDAGNPTNGNKEMSTLFRKLSAEHVRLTAEWTH